MFSIWYVLAIVSAKLYKLVPNELFCVMEQSTLCINGGWPFVEQKGAKPSSGKTLSSEDYSW